ncbi:hypothetical protein C8R46DRAFT_1060459 [Mycena filopes]|nr:hypothetical protein C8R46DRAFT_1060459 [Mycena filopes]
MGAFDKGFGVDLITSWFCVLLSGVGLTQAVRYFAKFSNDSLIKKALVGVVLFSLFLGVAAQCADSYTQVVTDWGNPTAFTIVTWPPSVAIFCTTFIGFIVDQFLIHRFYGLSKNIWVTVVLTLLNLFSLIMGLLIMQFFASRVGRAISLTELDNKLAPLTDIGSIINVVTDVGIAACLVWALRGLKTSFKSTNQLIQHIIAVSIQNGCTTSVMSIGGMVAHIVAPATKIDDFFFGLLGPLYLFTLLSNLTLPSHQSAPVPTSHGWSSNKNPASENGQVLFGGVHVRRSVITTAGTSTDFEAAYDDATVRDTSEDVAAGRKESEDPSSVNQNAEKI